MLLIEISREVTPGDYDLSLQSQYETCDVCVRIVDCPGDSCEEFEDKTQYLAQSGTIRIEEIDVAGARLFATLEEVLLSEVIIDKETWSSELVENGCATRIEQGRLASTTPPICRPGEVPCGELAAGCAIPCDGFATCTDGRDDPPTGGSCYAEWDNALVRYECVGGELVRELCD